MMKKPDFTSSHTSYPSPHTALSTPAPSD